MNLRQRSREEPDLNLTSLIDVVLLLLIFFMVSTTFVNEAGIKIRLPQTSAKSAAAPADDPIEITVTASGEFRVNGRALLNTRAATLSAAIAQVAGPKRVAPITIRADALATHQSVVTAMDVVGRLGFSVINIATISGSTDSRTPR